MEFQVHILECPQNGGVEIIKKKCFEIFKIEMSDQIMLFGERGGDTYLKVDDRQPLKVHTYIHT